MEAVVAQIHIEGIRPPPAVNRAASLYPITPTTPVLPVVTPKDRLDRDRLFDLAKVQPPAHN